ncbi:DUF3039 domain-containing protein [Corynebacterium casei]|uniref:DUF3039 domain-containing protein n=1 Tax=Corynebacterium casei TaxID=160386 RepID=UPI003851549A
MRPSPVVTDTPRYGTQPTVEGSGVRSMCGVYFVPSQDHGALPSCSTCEEMYSLLPKE